MEKEPQTQLGKVIRRRREALRHSQDSFADLIEMHRAYYGSIERGHRNLTLATLQKVAVALGAKPSELLREAGF